MAVERAGGERIRELKEKRRRRARVRFLLGCIAVIVLVVGLIGVTYIKQLQIQSVVVRGNYIITTESVTTLVQNVLHEKYGFVIPKSMVLVYPERFLERLIKERFPRASTVEIHRENWNTLVVDIVERKNVYLWCDGLPRERDDSSRTCYYVDDHGYIFSKSPTFSGNVYFVFYGAYTWGATESPVGKALFARDDYFKNIVRFKERLTELNLPPSGFITYPTGVSAFLLSPSFNDTKQKVVFTADQDLVTVIDNLSVAVTSASLQKQLTDSFASLQYLDLRYDKKMYYKFGNSPDATSQETVPVVEEQTQ